MQCPKALFGGAQSILAYWRLRKSCSVEMCLIQHLPNRCEHGTLSSWHMCSYPVAICSDGTNLGNSDLEQPSTLPFHFLVHKIPCIRRLTYARTIFWLDKCPWPFLSNWSLSLPNASFCFGLPECEIQFLKFHLINFHFTFMLLMTVAVTFSL